LRRYGTERVWTEHLATNAGARALLEAAGRAQLPRHVSATLHEILAALADETTLDEFGASHPLPTNHANHQLHLEGRFPDVAINDVREQIFAVIEAQRGRADDKHIAKLAAHYVPRSGARLGILVAEGWDPSRAGHPAWAVCPSPVVVLVAVDALHELDYQVAWVHYPWDIDGIVDDQDPDDCFS
jgi:predicted nucleic acid-binding protein